MAWDFQFWANILSKAGCAPAVGSAWAPILTRLDDSDFRVGRPELVQFLTQCLHETGKLKTLTENLNYSVAGLLATFGAARCPADIATRIGRVDGDHPRAADQKAIAIQVYGGAWGLKNLGNKGPTDGWDFRGSGLLQCTGRDNFLFLENSLKLPFTSNPDLLRTACSENLDAAIALWRRRVPVAIVSDDVAVRKAINGGKLGLDECIALKKMLTPLLA